MSYVQYTKCVDVNNKKFPFNSPSVLLVIATIATLLLGGFTPYTLVVELGIIIGYCEWWLYDRLICLGGDRCAIGLLGTPEPPENKSGLDAFDTDYSINLVLAPHQYQELPPDYFTNPPAPPPFGADPEEWADQKFKEALHRQIADDGLQGVLIKETNTTGDVTTVLGAKRYDFEGYFTTMPGSAVSYLHQPYLHCEFEGGGILQLLKAAKAALGFAAVAAVVCLIPVFGWVVCGILSLIAVIISIAGIIAALNDKGKPSVFDPKGQPAGALHPRDDILFVKGTWVFDTAHGGWNEIHPIKKCLLIAKARYTKSDVVDWDRAIAPFMVSRGRWQWDVTDPANLDPANLKPIKLDGPPKPTDWTDWVKSWCDEVESASQPITVDNQARPENKWQVHPVVDGCRPEQGEDAPGPDIR
jgi:hypothetical protein